jgi:hypothetical protein
MEIAAMDKKLYTAFAIKIPALKVLNVALLLLPVLLVQYATNVHAVGAISVLNVLLLIILPPQAKFRVP